MNTVTAWVMSVFVVVIIGLIIDILFSETRLARFMRTATASITVLLLVLPLPNLLKGGFSSDGDFLASYEYTPDAGYLSYVEGYRTASLERGVEELLSADGVTGAVVSINADYLGATPEISRVTVNLEKVVIDEKHAHIHKNELVTKLVCGYLRIDKDKVVTV